MAGNGLFSGGGFWLKQLAVLYKFIDAFMSDLSA